MNLALKEVNKHFDRAISNVHHIQRPPLTEDAKAVLERVLADPKTKMTSGYRRVLEMMIENS